MNKLSVAFAVVAVALALCCENAEAADKFAKELVINFERCLGRLPISVVGDDLKWVSSNQRWYVKYMDEIFFSRIGDVFLTGKETRPISEVRNFFDTPCLTDQNDVYITGQAVSEHMTSGTIGVTVPLSSTLQQSGIVTSVFSLPNTQTPALSVNWLPVLTNQRTYVLYMSCLPEGHLGFQVFSTVPRLDFVSRHQITSFLEIAGIPDNLSTITTYRASTCSNTP